MQAEEQTRRRERDVKGREGGVSEGYAPADFKGSGDCRAAPPAGSRAKDPSKKDGDVRPTEQ